MHWSARYVGLPFGEGPGEVHCWSLVRRVYAEVFGIDLPAYGDIGARDLIRVARAIESGAASEPWMAPAAPAEGDVCLMRSARGGTRVVHVGVMTDPWRVLHVEAATAAVVVGIRHFSVCERIVGWRRLVR